MNINTKYAEGINSSGFEIRDYSNTNLNTKSNFKAKIKGKDVFIPNPNVDER